MNKFGKILISILALLVITEGMSYVLYYMKYREAIKIQWQNGNKFFFTYGMPKEFSPDDIVYNWHNRVFKKNGGKKPFAVVGCSFAEGSCLEDKQTFGYKVSDMTNRTCYQRGVTATGLPYVYYQIKNKLIPQDSEYVVYVFIYDHLFRLNQDFLGYWSDRFNLRYEVKNGEVQQVVHKHPLLFSLYSTRLVREKLSDFDDEKEMQDFVTFKPLLAQTTVEFKKNYPNSKFVFLEYPSGYNDFFVLPPKIIDFIKEQGCIYINANDLTGKDLGEPEYKVEGEGLHPNEKAWDELTPKFVEKVGI